MNRVGARALLAALVVGALCAVPLAATAWNGDFFDGEAPGQAVYEEMAIHPQSVRVDDTVYTVYQGYRLDPYIVAFHDNGVVEGPYRVGENPLGATSDPDDSHGAPSLLFDPDNQRLHVFFGAHGTNLRHATASAGNIAFWNVKYESSLGSVTYPQVFRDDTGLSHLFYRRDQDVTVATRTVDRGSWWHAVSVNGGSTWTSATPVLAAKKASGSVPGWRYYAHVEPGIGGVMHLVTAVQTTDYSIPYARKGVYYTKWDPATSRWVDAFGAAVGATDTPLGLGDLAATSTVCSIPVGSGFQNGVTAADDGTGSSGLLFVGGETAYGPEACDWTFASFDASASAWVTRTIAPTDFVMDSGALDYNDGGIDAFLTVGGSTETTPVDPYDYRGGDIAWFRSEDGGATWLRKKTLAVTDRGRAVYYNDPQIVVDHDSAAVGAPDSRVLFGEWNNDAGAMVHKVFLWGEDSGFRGREFFPDVERLSGKDRYETAVAISSAAFPNGSDTVIVASGEVFADALAGGPLAEAYRAPLLLVPGEGVPTAVKNEIVRLKAKKVIVLGGPATITDANLGRLKVGSVTSVSRISGRDRYACAAAIATELKKLKGQPSTAFVVSGEAFADALSASSVAAARGVPVLLTRPTSVPPATLSVLKSLDVTRTIVVGGPVTVQEPAMSMLPSPQRISGYDRYALAAEVARVALDGGYGLPPSFKTTRFSIASGQVFPDALAGAPLAARARGPLLLTTGASLAAPARSLLEERAPEGRDVLRCWVLGGEKTIHPLTFADIVGILYEK